MRITVMTAIGLACICTSSFAGDDDVMTSRFGNTTIVTAPDGTQTKNYYRADHTFTIKQGQSTSDGTWEIKDGKICRTYKTPPAGVTNPECIPAEMHHVGDKWTAHGNSVSLVSGIQ